MPIVFVHGVGNRDSEGYRQGVAARDALFERLLVAPLAAKGIPFGPHPVVNPLWGQYGAAFKWNLASLPGTQGLEYLGANTIETPDSDQTMVDTLNDLAAVPTSGLLEALGSNEGRFRQAAQADLTRFLEAVLSPIILQEMVLTEGTGESAEVVGLRTALLLEASQQVADDPSISAQLAAAGSDEEAMTLLEQALLARYEWLARESGLLPPPQSGGLEGMGVSDMFRGLGDQVGEMFDRAMGAPGRVVTVPIMGKTRESLHRSASMFVGDPLVYVSERDKGANSDILRVILAALRETPRQPGEPLIVVTHSMGGNIMYDILTHYAKDIEVDAWISVGGQVGQLEEMKLFKESDPQLGPPNKVESLKPRVKFWLNVYDPADPFSFLTEPIFKDVKDQKFLTGSSVFKSHSAYFLRPSFYEMVLGHLERELRSR